VRVFKCKKQPIETLPNASNMARDSAVAESSVQGARHDDDDADGAADGTMRNDAEGGKADTQVEATRCK
jgi:hypothetical protein